MKDADTISALLDPRICTNGNWLRLLFAGDRKDAALETLKTAYVEFGLAVFDFKASKLRDASEALVAPALGAAAAPAAAASEQDDGDYFDDMFADDDEEDSPAAGSKEEEKERLSDAFLPAYKSYRTHCRKVDLVAVAMQQGVIEVKDGDGTPKALTIQQAYKVNMATVMQYMSEVDNGANFLLLLLARSYMSANLTVAIAEGANSAAKQTCNDANACLSPHKTEMLTIMRSGREFYNAMTQLKFGAGKKLSVMAELPKTAEQGAAEEAAAWASGSVQPEAAAASEAPVRFNTTSQKWEALYHKAGGGYIVINSYQQKEMAIAKARQVKEYVSCDEITEGDVSDADREGAASVFGSAVAVVEEEEEEEECLENEEEEEEEEGGGGGGGGGGEKE